MVRLLIQGVCFLFFSLVEYAVVLMYTDFKMLLTLEITNRVEGNIIDNVPEPFWGIYRLQLAVSLLLIGVSIVYYLSKKFIQK